MDSEHTTKRSLGWKILEVFLADGLSPPEQRYTLNHPAVTDGQLSLFLGLLKQENLLKALMLCERSEILAGWVASEDTAVRCAVAANRFTANYTMDVLLDDPNELVRTVALFRDFTDADATTILDWIGESTAETQRSLIAADDWFIRYSQLLNSQLPLEPVSFLYAYVPEVETWDFLEQRDNDRHHEFEVEFWSNMRAERVRMGELDANDC